MKEDYSLTAAFLNVMDRVDYRYDYKGLLQCSEIRKKKTSNAAIKALDILESYEKAPQMLYRKSVLDVVRSSIETNHSKFTQSIAGIFFRISKDNRFHTKLCELEENEDNWMCSQVLSSITGLDSFADNDSKNEVIKGVLLYTSQPYWQLNGRLTIQILSLCIDLYWKGNSSLRTSVQNLSCQTLHEFCKQVSNLRHTNTEIHNEVIPIFQFIISKLEEIHKKAQQSTSSPSANTGHSPELPLLLESLYALVNSVCPEVIESPHFVRFVWQKLSPTLISYLGFAVISCSSASPSIWRPGKPKNNSIVKLDHQSARTMLCIAMEVSNLIGPSGSLRPVLESIFHRILIHPKKHDRLGPITVVTDMLNSTDNLQCLSYIKYKNPDHEVDSMAVFKLLVKALEECCEGEDTPDQGLIAQSLDCLRSLLKTMTKFITKECIHESVAADILKLYPKLSDSDYKGPFTYDVETSLPQEYKDIIKKEKEYNESSESDSKKLEKEKSLEESQEENVVPEVENDGTDIDEGIAGSDLSDELSEDTEGPEEGFDNDEDIGSELKNVVNQKLNRGSTVEIDSHLQQFASDFCRRYSNYSPETNGSESLEPGIIMNADGIYLTSYMSLHLSLSMALNGEFKYSERENDKRQNNSKLKEEFINEILGSGLLVYLSSNWLSKVYDLITEYDIFGFCLQYKEKGSRHILYPILSDIDGFSSSKEGSQLLSEYCRLSKGDSKYDHQKVDACKRVCRRIITTTWSSILSLLNKSLDPYILPEYNSKTNPIFLRSKKSNRFRKNDGLINIGIECLEYAVSLCSILELHDRCGSVLSPLTNLVIGNWEPCAPKRCKLNGKSLRVIEKILVDGIELGSQSQDCWKHVIKCINYVISLDKAYDVEYKVKPLDAVGNALSYPMGRQDEQSYLKDVLMQDQKDADKILSKDLNTALSSACLRILTPKVDKLCDDVSQKLNLKALLGFLSELCFSSHKELLMVFPSKKRNVSKHKLKWQNVSKEGSSSNSSGDPPHSRIYDDLMIHKIGDLMLKFIKSGRPLIHIVRAWAINFVIWTFRIRLYQAFVNLLKATRVIFVLDGDPCFGTLKAVQFSIVMESDISHIRSVLDVFNAFLSTDSPEIFAYAALDCVGCLIKHINGKEDTSYEIEINLDTYTNDVVVAADKDLSRSLFRYILRCHDMFFVMHDMPSRPVFHGAHKICLPNMPTLVDPIISHFEIHQFHESTNTVPEFDYSFDNLLSLEYEEDFQLTGDPQRLFKVWFLLLDGITNAVATIGKEHQSATVDSLFEILDTFVEKELEFGLYCTNHLLLPMLQKWLRRSQRTFQGWVNSGPNFKHCMGKTTELVLKWLKVKPNSLLVLKQLLLVLVECTLVPIEGIARLGCACFRHILLSRSTELTKEQWTTVVLSLCRAGQLTLYPLHQIMVAFHRGSSNFYGDVGSVQIAARRDSSRKENHRLQLLAQQVLLLDQQQGEVPKLPECPDAQERSFLFLLTPPSKKETQETMYRVTLRSLITGLAAHNIILQTIGTILLQGTNHNVPSLANIVLPKASPPSSPNFIHKFPKLHSPWNSLSWNLILDLD
ncbi:unnamed protein product [Lepeophtheirus salmonis]|uniref:(salmon louse) hypothetical protein n=1 Tax=Lepeophtheirus salmonis TaxID=72036 RepID=A0A7R8D6R2_LEPSM|nr:unnamed protein product [Lepeophtheirus salmonis]CAF3046326.1 unnamed protein product [Lepeophtheirus salmonis]